MTKSQLSLRALNRITLSRQLLLRRSALAATFAAALEHARLGRLELRQDRAFGPIYLRSPPETP